MAKYKEPTNNKLNLKKDSIEKNNDISDEEKKSSISSISAVNSSIISLQKEIQEKTTNKNPSKSLILKDRIGSEKGEQRLITGLERTIKNLSSLTSNMSQHAKTITIETVKGIKKVSIGSTKTIKEATGQYAKAIGEDINYNRNNLLVTTLGKASPLIGYSVAKLMDTEVFQNMLSNIKEKFNSAITSVGTKFKSMISSSWEKTKFGVSSLIDRITNRDATKVELSKKKNISEIPENIKNENNIILNKAKNEALEQKEKNKLLKNISSIAKKNPDIEKKKAKKIIPHLATGGLVTKEGIVKVHAGEVVQPVDKMIETILERVDKKIDIKEKESNKEKESINPETIIQKALSNTTNTVVDTAKDSAFGMKSMIDIMQRRSLKLESHVRRMGDDSKKGIIKSFFEAYKDEAQSHEWDWQERVLRELIALRESTGTEINALGVAWERTLYEHPVFRQFINLGKVLKNTFIGVPKFIFGKRGGYEGNLPKGGEPMQNTVTILGMIYAGEMSRLDLISDHLKNILIETRESSGTLSGELNKNISSLSDFNKQWTIGGGFAKYLMKPAIRSIAAPIEFATKHILPKSISTALTEKKTLSERVIPKVKSLGKGISTVAKDTLSLGKAGLKAGFGGYRDILNKVSPKFLQKEIGNKDNKKKGIFQKLKEATFKGTYQKVKKASVTALPKRMQQQLALMERSREESKKQKDIEIEKNKKKTTPDLIKILIDVESKILNTLSSLSNFIQTKKSSDSPVDQLNYKSTKVKSKPIQKPIINIQNAANDQEYKSPIIKPIQQSTSSVKSPKPANSRIYNVFHNLSEILNDQLSTSKDILHSQAGMITIGGLNLDVIKKGFRNQFSRLSQLKDISKQQVQKLKDSFLLAKKEGRTSNLILSGIKGINKGLKKSSSLIWKMIMGIGPILSSIVPGLIAGLPVLLAGAVGLALNSSLNKFWNKLEKREKVQRDKSLATMRSDLKTIQSGKATKEQAIQTKQAQKIRSGFAKSYEERTSDYGIGTLSTNYQLISDSQQNYQNEHINEYIPYGHKQVTDIRKKWLDRLFIGGFRGKNINETSEEYGRLREENFLNYLKSKGKVIDKETLEKESGVKKRHYKSIKQIEKPGKQIEKPISSKVPSIADKLKNKLGEIKDILSKKPLNIDIKNTIVEKNKKYKSKNIEKTNLEKIDPLRIRIKKINDIFRSKAFHLKTELIEKIKKLKDKNKSKIIEKINLEKIDPLHERIKKIKDRAKSKAIHFKNKLIEKISPEKIDLLEKKIKEIKNEFTEKISPKKEIEENISNSLSKTFEPVSETFRNYTSIMSSKFDELIMSINGKKPKKSLSQNLNDFASSFKNKNLLSNKKSNEVFLKFKKESSLALDYIQNSIQGMVQSSSINDNIVETQKIPIDRTEIARIETQPEIRSGKLTKELSKVSDNMKGIVEKGQTNFNQVVQNMNTIITKSIKSISSNQVNSNDNISNGNDEYITKMLTGDIS